MVANGLPAGLDGNPKAPRVTPAVTRTFSILRLVRRGGRLTVRSAPRALQLPRSTVHELVHTLVQLGALAPAVNGIGRFTLGLLLHELGSAYLSEGDLAREGQRVAEIVAEACGETVHFAALDGGEVVYVGKVGTIRAGRMVPAVGRRVPAHCAAVGKALLSGLSDDELAARFGGADVSLPAMTPHSISNLAA